MLSFKAVIFDKDGVLMHTEKIYFQAYHDTILFFGGSGTYSWEDHKKFMGALSSERFLFIRKKFHLPVSFDEFMSEYRKRYYELFDTQGIKVIEGISDFIELLKANGIKLAVFTGSSRKNTEFTLKKVNLSAEFDAIVTADDVSQGKPHPEGFLLAAKLLKVEPADCVVIGDSGNDVIAAKDAGMRVIALVDENYIRDPELAKPDLEVDSLKEINVQSLQALASSG